MNILDYLPVNDLIKVAPLSPHIADIILNRYIIGKFRLHEKAITASTGILIGETTNEKVYVAHGLSETRLALKLFGHLFKHLRYEVERFGTPKWQKLFEYYDKYCPQATKEIDIYSVDENALANWAYSFDQSTTHISIRRNSIQLNDFFPFMQHLTAHELSNSMVQHYPHLTNCAIISFYDDHRNPNAFELIRLNPQLHHFHTTMRSNVSYLKYVSEMLPDLESLSIKMDIDPRDTDPETVHFKNVKEFKLVAFTGYGIPRSWSVIGNIRFNQLDVLKFETLSIVYADEIVEMMAVNKGLKKFETNLRMTPESFSALLQTLPQLEEISIYCIGKVN